jgi:hypothetical protein
VGLSNLCPNFRPLGFDCSVCFSCKLGAGLDHAENVGCGRPFRRMSARWNTRSELLHTSSRHNNIRARQVKQHDKPTHVFRLQLQNPNERDVCVQTFVFPGSTGNKGRVRVLRTKPPRDRRSYPLGQVHSAARMRPSRKRSVAMRSVVP